MYRMTSYYDFIPVDSTLRRKITEHDFTKRSKIEKVHTFKITLQVHTPIHVGSGLKHFEKKGNMQNKVLSHYKDSENKPVIPGSSLKGVVSTNYLALTGSSLFSSELFGSAEHPAISKLFFSDVRPLWDIGLDKLSVERAWSPRRHKRACVKVYVSRAPQTQYYGQIEAIPKDTKLSTEVVGINLRNFEVGGFLMALGINVADDKLETGFLKIGYGKPQAYGQVRLLPEECQISEIKFVGLKLQKSADECMFNSAYCIEKLKVFKNEIKRIDTRRNIEEIFSKLFCEIQ